MRYTQDNIGKLQKKFRKVFTFKKKCSIIIKITDKELSDNLLKLNNLGTDKNKNRLFQANEIKLKIEYYYTILYSSQCLLYYGTSIAKSIEVELYSVV